MSRYLECWCCGRFVKFLHGYNKKCGFCHNVNGTMERFLPKDSLKTIDYIISLRADKRHPRYLILELDE